MSADGWNGRGTHGSSWAYQNGCRCNACVAAHAKHAKNWRAKRPYPLQKARLLDEDFE